MNTTRLMGAFVSALRRRSGTSSRTMAAMAVLLALMAEQSHLCERIFRAHGGDGLGDERLQHF